MTITRLILPLITVLSLITNAQAQNVNGAFENWDSVRYNEASNFLPEGWFEFSNPVNQKEGLPLSVIRTNDAHSGNYAIQLTNVDNGMGMAATLMCGFIDEQLGFVNRIPVNARYAKFEGYYKYSSPGVDTFTVSVFMLKGEDFVGMGLYEQHVTASTYTKFEVPITYMSPAGIIPDSVAILINAGKDQNMIVGSSLILDDLAFVSQTTGIIENPNALSGHVSIYPNPAKTSTAIQIDKVVGSIVKIEVLNLLGQVVKTQEEQTNQGSLNTVLDLTDLPTGVLFVKVSDMSGTSGFRVIHQ